jgi:protein PsiE
VLAVSAAILLLTLAVLVIRYGHTRFPYREAEEKIGRSDAPPPER